MKTFLLTFNQLLNVSILSLIFYGLAFLLVVLIIVYYMQRRRLKGKVKPVKDTQTDDEFSLNQTYERLLDYFSKGLYKEGIIFSYNQLRDYLIKVNNIVIAQYETEREIVENHYYKIVNDPAIKKLYISYEKSRFGKANFQINEIEEYKSNFLKILNLLNKNANN